MKRSRSVLYAAFSLAGGCFAFALLLQRDRLQEGLLLLLAGSVLAAAMLYYPVQLAREAEKQRQEELARDYSQMVTLLSLYMTAGLTLRSSWEQLVRNYEEEKRRSGRTAPVYEEMLATWRDLKGGMYEDRAYGSFGRRCGRPEYLRLGGLLETYVQQGNKELLLLLEQEASSSLTQALQEVKKKGEQTGTKLLLPLLLLFALTLLIVMVPAMLSMQAKI
ncbi:MAG: hypothetical protein IKI82_02500 [Lachnospiraceae bacterium]|jgi:Flp pilus assembly protein TadB|nr:hypothetical protein [Lachnospiraceae bacterium]